MTKMKKNAQDKQAQFKILFSREEIGRAVDRIAAEIMQDYRGKQLVLVGILKGSFVFMADIIRRLDLPLEIEFIRLSSYSGDIKSTGEIKLIHGLETSIKGKDVLVIEDIVDTGLTVSFLLDFLQKEHPASLKLCALTDKPDCRKVSVPIKYLGFTVPDKFIVGYGLDLDEKFRELPDICCIEDNND